MCHSHIAQRYSNNLKFKMKNKSFRQRPKKLKMTSSLFWGKIKSDLTTLFSIINWGHENMCPMITFFLIFIFITFLTISYGKGTFGYHLLLKVKNWKYCNKIIFKCVINTMEPNFKVIFVFFRTYKSRK